MNDIVRRHKRQRMEPVIIRIPRELKERVALIAIQNSADGNEVTAADIYRAAVIHFVEIVSTEAREEET
jgi:hypothetical protein